MTTGTSKKAERRLAIVLKAIASAADKGVRCPSNPEIAHVAGVSSGASAVRMIDILAARGLIRVERYQASRVVTVVSTGKSTAGRRGATHWRDREPVAAAADRSAHNRAQYDGQKRRAAEAASNIPCPPAPIDWATVLAEQDAKPAADRWPYVMPAIVERPNLSRPATHVLTGTTLA